MPPFGPSSSSPTYYGGCGSRGPGRIPRSDLLVVGNDAPRASRKSGPKRPAAEAWDILGLVVWQGLGGRMWELADLVARYFCVHGLCMVLKEIWNQNHIIACRRGARRISSQCKLVARNLEIQARCRCGTTYTADSAFCRVCGEKRPSVPSVPPRGPNGQRTATPPRSVSPGARSWRSKPTTRPESAPSAPSHFSCRNGISLLQRLRFGLILCLRTARSYFLCLKVLKTSQKDLTDHHLSPPLYCS